MVVEAAKIQVNVFENECSYQMRQLRLKWVGQSWQVAVLFKNAGLQGSTLSDHHRPVAYLRDGKTTPHLRLVLFEESSFWLAFTVL